MGKRINGPLADSRIKEARIRKIKTQQELADAVGLTRKQIDLIENRKSSPNLVNCIKICDYLGCALSELFDDVSENAGDENANWKS